MDQLIRSGSPKRLSISTPESFHLFHSKSCWIHLCTLRSGAAQWRCTVVLRWTPRFDHYRYVCMHIMYMYYYVYIYTYMYTRRKRMEKASRSESILQPQLLISLKSYWKTVQAALYPSQSRTLVVKPGTISLEGATQDSSLDEQKLSALLLSWDSRRKAVIIHWCHHDLWLWRLKRLWLRFGPLM